MILERALLHDIDFLDRATVDFIQPSALLSSVLPSGALGQAAALRLRPFVRGQEQALEAHFVKLAFLENAYEKTFGTLRESLKQFRNITTSLSKLRSASPVNLADLFEIKRFLLLYERLREDFGIESLPGFRFIPLTSALRVLDPEEKRQMFFSLESDYLRDLRSELEKASKQEAIELKQHCDLLQKQYEIPVRNQREFVLSRTDIRNLALQKCEWISLIRESTFSIHYQIIGGERTRTLQMKKQEIHAEIEVEEQRLIEEIHLNLQKHAAEMMAQMTEVGALDLALALVAFKKAYHFVYPTVLGGSNTSSAPLTLVLEKGRDPILEAERRQKGLPYDPLTISLKEGATLVVGANMGGKTTALRTLGLLVLLAHMGIPTPTDRFELPLFSRIYALYKTKEQDGLSGFGSEIVRAKSAFSPFSLSLIDEFASSTNPSEGEALAAALVEHAHGVPNQISLFVTHYSKPLSITAEVYTTGILRSIDGQNYENLEALYRLIDHRLHRLAVREIPRGAFTVAKALGFSDTILEKATDYLNKS